MGSCNYTLGVLTTRTYYSYLLLLRVYPNTQYTERRTMSSLTLGEIYHRIPAWYTASIMPGGPSYHLEGPPGCGKTELFKRFDERMLEIDPHNTYAMGYLNGASLTESRLMGFMQLISAINKSDTLQSSGIESNTHTEQLMRSVFSLPFWWFLQNGRPISDYSGGIIFIDEYDKMDLEVKKMAADMRLNKCIANHYLPEDWPVWSAGNRAGIDRSGSTKEFAFERNRRIDVSVRPSALEWGEHMRRKTECLTEIIDFGENNSELLYQPVPTTNAPFCSPRSLAQADMHIRAHMKVFGLTKIPTNDLALQTEIAGGISKEVAEHLWVHLIMGTELPDYKQVIDTPESIEIPTQTDQLRLLALKIADGTQPKDAPQLIKFINRLPQEFQIMLVKMAADRNKFVLVQPAMREWSRKNMHVIAMIDDFARRHTTHEMRIVAP